MAFQCETRWSCGSVLTRKQHLTIGSNCILTKQQSSAICGDCSSIFRPVGIKAVPCNPPHLQHLD